MSFIAGVLLMGIMIIAFVYLEHVYKSRSESKSQKK